MPETLRQKRAKPRLELTYSYLCAQCRWIAEAPADLLCCGAPMISLSRLYQFAGKTVIAAIGLQDEHEQKKTPVGGDIRQGPQGNHNLAYYLTAREDA